MIYVTVGVSRGFERLVRAADAIAAGHAEPFALQTGDTAYEPVHARSVDVLPPAEHERRLREATCVVAHAGAGTMLSAVEADARLVAFPRDPARDEVWDDHQLRSIEGWADRLGVPVARTRAELAELLETPAAHPRLSGELSGDLPANIADVVCEEVFGR